MGDPGESQAGVDIQALPAPSLPSVISTSTPLLQAPSTDQQAPATAQLTRGSSRYSLGT